MSHPCIRTEDNRWSGKCESTDTNSHLLTSLSSATVRIGVVPKYFAESSRPPLIKYFEHYVVVIETAD
jgi:hypothetical protein